MSILRPRSPLYQPAVIYNHGRVPIQSAHLRMTQLNRISLDLAPSRKDDEKSSPRLFFCIVAAQHGLFRCLTTISSKSQSFLFTASTANTKPALIHGASGETKITLPVLSQKSWRHPRRIYNEDTHTVHAMFLKRFSASFLHFPPKHSVARSGSVAASFLLPFCIRYTLNVDKQSVIRRNPPPLCQLG